MKKVVLAIILALLIISLVGCSSEQQIKIKKVENGEVKEVDLPTQGHVVLVVNEKSEGHLVPVDGNTYLAD